MEKLLDVLQNAASLKKDKNFSQALDLYRSIVDTSYSKLNNWDKYCFAYCLEKQGFYEESLKVCRDVWQNDKNLIYNNKLYALVIYMSKLRKDLDTDPKDVVKAIDGINRLVSHNDFPLLALSTFHAIDKLSDQFKVDYLYLLHLLENLNPDLLRKECFSNTNEQNKKSEFASDYENYFSKKTNCMLELKQYQNCINCCEEALSRIDVMHNNNDVWFKRRKAMALASLNQLDEALVIYKEIVFKKPDSYIYKEIADIYIKQNNYKIAKEMIGKGILCYGDLEYKIGLLLQAYNILLKLDEPDLAIVHLRLYVLVRRKNQWNLPLDIESLVKTISDEVSDIPKLKIQVNNFWSSYYLKQGTIKTIVKDFGFINCENKEYFFQMRNVISKNLNVSIGAKVTFRLTSAFDKKKNKEVENAIDIKIVGV